LANTSGRISIVLNPTYMGIVSIGGSMFITLLLQIDNKPGKYSISRSVLKYDKPAVNSKL